MHVVKGTKLEEDEQICRKESLLKSSQKSCMFAQLSNLDSLREKWFYIRGKRGMEHGSG